MIRRQAVLVLSRIDRPLSQDLWRCLDEKSNSQYGVRFLTEPRARDLIKRARRLVDAVEARTR